MNKDTKIVWLAVDTLIPYEKDDRTQSTVFEDNIDFENISKEKAIELLKEMFKSFSTTAMHEDKPVANVLHPTMKPINLLARQIKNSTKRNENVLDPFGGSGSTLIACEQLERNCYMVELDPKYCDVIIQRWENLTGQKAVKL